MKIVLVLIALAFVTDTASAQSWDAQTQTDVVCAAALLWTAEHKNTPASARSKYTAGAVKYMQRIPSVYHDTIDIALTQLAVEPYANVKQGADSCLQML
jgi:trans-aconitate methyltransferase